MMGATEGNPHVGYVTSVFGYPPMGGPWLRTYNTVKAISRVTQVSLYLLGPPEGVDEQACRDHLLSFCRSVDWPGREAHTRVSAKSGERASILKIMKDWLKGSPLVPGLVWESVARRVRRVRQWRASRRQEAFQRRSELEAIAEWIRANKVDIVWVGYGNILYHLIRLKRMTGRKVVIDTDSVWSRYVRRQLTYERDRARRMQIRLSYWRKRWEELWGTNSADITTAVSEVDQAYYRRLTLLKRRVKVLSNVIDVEGYSEVCPTTAPLGKPALCYTGTMAAAPSEDAVKWFVDEVMPIVWQQHPDVHLYVVGRDPSEEIQRRGSERIKITGSVPSVIPYLCNADVAVVPLRFESGTRFKIMEAFACKVPVVSTTLGAEGLPVEHMKHLLIANTPSEFAAAIACLLSDRGVRDRLIEQAYRLVVRECGMATAIRQVGEVLNAVQ